MRFYQRSWSIALCLVACSCLPVVGYRSPNLHGRVVDAESNKPIIAATIYLQKYPEVNTSTNERGLFVLPSFQKWEWCVALPDYCLIRQRPELAGIVAEGYTAGKLEFLSPAALEVSGEANIRLEPARREAND